MRTIHRVCTLAALLLLVTATVVQAQGLSVEFVKLEDERARPSKDDLLTQYDVKAKGLTVGKKYTVTIGTDYGLTTLSPTAYSLLQPSTTFQATKVEHDLFFFLKLNKDQEADRERKLVLKVEVKEDDVDVSGTNTGTNKRLSITIKPITTDLDGYNFLAYVGTNFDLVDGVKAKNLFFATNIYLPNKNKDFFNTGAYISLYGNRPISLIDSTGRTSRLIGVEPTSDSTYTEFYEKAERTTVFTADNLGAFFSPLINLGGVSDPTEDLALYLAPSAEFIFRRTQRITSFTNGVASDTIADIPGRRPLVELPSTYASTSNSYEFRYGLGFLLAHEGETMSVRLSTSVGWASLYLPVTPTSAAFGETQYDRFKGEVSFSGRVWITHRGSGLTLQAEVLNSMKRPRPFYGVTLSKAIAFKDLGNVFKPIGRDSSD